MLGLTSSEVPTKSQLLMQNCFESVYPILKQFLPGISSNSTLCYRLLILVPVGEHQEQHKIYCVTWHVEEKDSCKEICSLRKKLLQKNQLPRRHSFLKQSIFSHVHNRCYIVPTTNLPKTILTSNLAFSIFDNEKIDPVARGRYSYIFPYGDVPLNRVSFSGF